jgi:hypothetical protein
MALPTAATYAIVYINVIVDWYAIAQSRQLTQGKREGRTSPRSSAVGRLTFRHVLQGSAAAACRLRPIKVACAAYCFVFQP